MVKLLPTPAKRVDTLYNNNCDQLPHTHSQLVPNHIRMGDLLRHAGRETISCRKNANLLNNLQRVNAAHACRQPRAITASVTDGTLSVPTLVCSEQVVSL